MPYSEENIRIVEEITRQELELIRQLETAKEPPLLEALKKALPEDTVMHIDSLMLGTHNPEACNYCKIETAFQEFSKDWIGEDDPGDECYCAECIKKRN